jgi:hypothetical protein
VAADVLPPLVLPTPVSRRPGFALLKRLVRSATAFEVDPVVEQLNALRAVTIQALLRHGHSNGEGPGDGNPTRR